eukprot:10805_1
MPPGLWGFRRKRVAGGGSCHIEERQSKKRHYHKTSSQLTTSRTAHIKPSIHQTTRRPSNPFAQHQSAKGSYSKRTQRAHLTYSVTTPTKYPRRAN